MRYIIISLLCVFCGCTTTKQIDYRGINGRELIDIERQERYLVETIDGDMAVYLHKKLPNGGVIYNK